MTIQKGVLIDSRVDHQVIAKLVKPGSHVLDVGCGDGVLLSLLETTKQVEGRGIELSQAGVNASVARGLAVIQGNADTDLAVWPDQSFDYVILSQALQAMQAPRDVLEHLVRIGRYVIVSIPNFGHWRIRMNFLVRGRMPVTKNLPYSWYDTPNIHFCTLRDFVSLCREIDAEILEATALNASGYAVPFRAPWWIWNLIGEQAIFLIRKKI